MSDSHAHGSDDSRSTDDGHHDHEAHTHGDHDGHSQGDHHDHDADTVAVAVVTVSSSRSLDSGDRSGEYVATAFEEAGHEVSVRELVPDEYDSVQGTVDRLARRKDTDVVVTTGGTGVTPDDVTPEAVRPLFAKTLAGFGELFRRLSYEEIGTRTIGSRATAGIAAGTPVFCLPGSENAVRLGVDEILLPEVGHLVGLAGRDREDDADEDSGGSDDENGDEPRKSEK